jgi:hypothetical protein
MARFKCNVCNQEYEDYYPPDDTCIKCKKGTIRIIKRYKNSFPQRLLITLLIHCG